MIKFTYRFITFLIVLWLCGYAGYSIYIIKMTPNVSQQKTDALIVPTGGATHRIKEALALHAQGFSDKIFITGVHKDVTVKEIKAMYEGKLPECCIILGHIAQTTIENAEETAEWIKENNIKTVRLITTNYHMPRAFLEFKAKLQGTKIITHPVKAGTPSEKTGWFWRLTLREYNKFLFRLTLITLEKMGLGK